MKKLNAVSMSDKQVNKLLRKSAFSQYVNSLVQKSSMEIPKEANTWECCNVTFQLLKDLHKHVSFCHSQEVQELAVRQKLILQQRKTLSDELHQGLCLLEEFLANDIFLDKAENFICTCTKKIFVVLLFYHYVNISDQTSQIKEWQEMLCENLKLKGKIRVASEGINGTVEGCCCAANRYKITLLKCTALSEMSMEDFKCSPGTGHCFDQLTVSECTELCTLGIPPSDLKSSEGGSYLSPEQFHEALKTRLHLKESGHSKDVPILLDCRNFYESKIGYFDDALKPNLRKFSYFPEYVDENHEMFDGREVLTYCTGGIRCERASAYLKKATKCTNVFQLHGGIHKYMEKYPTDGFYKGKLFVFDNRYSISNLDSKAVSTCIYCAASCSDYQLCSTLACRQLVLVCQSCRSSGKTTCCNVCESNAKLGVTTRQCACTETRDRVEKEKIIS